MPATRQSTIAALLGLGAVLLVMAGATLVWWHGGKQAAEQALHAGDWTRAERRLRSYLLIHPNDNEAGFLLAQALLASGQHEAAVEQLGRIDVDSPRSADARYQEGHTLLVHLRRAAQAEERLLKALEIEPGHSKARSLLLYLYQLESREQDASTWVWRVYANSEPPVQLELLTQWFLIQYAEPFAPEIQAMLTEVVKADPTDMNALAALISSWRRTGKVQQANEFLPKLQLDRAGLDARAVAIQCDLDLGDSSSALRRLDEWPEAKRNGRYWKLRGIERQLFGDKPREAVAFFERAVALAPDDWEAYYRLSQSARAAGDVEAADRAYQESERLKRVLASTTVSSLLAELQADGATIELCRKVADFYQQLHKDDESRSWREQAERLKSAGDPPATISKSDSETDAKS